MITLRFIEWNGYEMHCSGLKRHGSLVDSNVGGIRYMFSNEQTGHNVCSCASFCFLYFCFGVVVSLFCNSAPKGHVSFIFSC